MDIDAQIKEFARQKGIKYYKENKMNNASARKIKKKRENDREKMKHNAINKKYDMEKRDMELYIKEIENKYKTSIKNLTREIEKKIMTKKPYSKKREKVVKNMNKKYPDLNIKDLGLNIVVNVKDIGKDRRDKYMQDEVDRFFTPKIDGTDMKSEFKGELRKIEGGKRRKTRKNLVDKLFKLAGGKRKCKYNSGIVYVGGNTLPCPFCGKGKFKNIPDFKEHLEKPENFSCQIKYLNFQVNYKNKESKEAALILAEMKNDTNMKVNEGSEHMNADEYQKINFIINELSKDLQKGGRRKKRRATRKRRKKKTKRRRKQKGGTNPIVFTGKEELIERILEQIGPDNVGAIFETEEITNIADANFQRSSAVWGDNKKIYIKREDLENLGIEPANSNFQRLWHTTNIIPSYTIDNNGMVSVHRHPQMQALNAGPIVYGVVRIKKKDGEWFISQDIHAGGYKKKSKKRRRKRKTRRKRK